MVSFASHPLGGFQTGSFAKIGGDGGTVECDETFIGGLAKNMHKAERTRKIKGTGGNGKTAVIRDSSNAISEKGKSKVREGYSRILNGKPFTAKS